MNKLTTSQAYYTWAIYLIMAAFCTANVVTGPLRWMFALVKLTPLIYLPTMGLLLGIAWTLFRNWQRHGISRLQVVTLAVLAYAVVLGLFFTPVVQVVFGVYVLLPFFFGLVAAPVILHNPEQMQRYIFILWVIACVGVLLNVLVTYPWEGFEYEVAGQSIEGAREWQSTGGGKRLAGFSRSSFDGAIQIQLLAIAFIMLRRGLLGNILIWLISGAAIFFTTSKGIYNVFLVLTPVVFLKERMPERVLRAWPLFFGLISLWLVVSTQFIDYSFSINDPFWANITFSFYDRLNNMWPEAWALIAQHGSPLLGRGFGGLGTAQTYFEPELFNAGDNLFMYWIVIFGWLALVPIIILLLASLWIRPWTRKGDSLPYALTLATIVYGITTNVVENAFFAITCGMVVHFLAVRMREALSAR